MLGESPQTDPPAMTTPLAHRPRRAAIRLEALAEQSTPGVRQTCPMSGRAILSWGWEACPTPRGDHSTKGQAGPPNLRRRLLHQSCFELCGFLSGYQGTNGCFVDFEDLSEITPPILSASLLPKLCTSRRGGLGRGPSDRSFSSAEHSTQLQNCVDVLEWQQPGTLSWGEPRAPSPRHRDRACSNFITPCLRVARAISPLLLGKVHHWIFPESSRVQQS